MNITMPIILWKTVSDYKLETLPKPRYTMLVTSLRTLLDCNNGFMVLKALSTFKLNLLSRSRNRDISKFAS